MDAVSNVRPIAILAGYMATAILLTSFCIAVIRVRWDATAGLSSAERARRRTAISVFSILATLSFATTWYHKFRFFEWSYTQWAFSSGAEQLLTNDPNGLHLGQWLRDTTLFKQAWASTLDAPPRAWWSMQIFGFLANWSVMLAAQCEFSSLFSLFLLPVHADNNSAQPRRDASRTCGHSCSWARSLPFHLLRTCHFSHSPSMT